MKLFTVLVLAGTSFTAASIDPSHERQNSLPVQPTITDGSGDLTSQLGGPLPTFSLTGNQLHSSITDLLTIPSSITEIIGGTSSITNTAVAPFTTATITDSSGSEMTTTLIVRETSSSSSSIAAGSSESTSQSGSSSASAAVQTTTTAPSSTSTGAAAQAATYPTGVVHAAGVLALVGAVVVL